MRKLILTAVEEVRVSWEGFNNSTKNDTLIAQSALLIEDNHMNHGKIKVFQFLIGDGEIFIILVHRNYLYCSKHSRVSWYFKPKNMLDLTRKHKYRSTSSKTTDQWIRQVHGYKTQS